MILFFVGLIGSLACVKYLPVRLASCFIQIIKTFQFLFHLFHATLSFVALDLLDKKNYDSSLN